MATEFSDIYIDGITTEKLWAGGKQIREAWLDGKCIWRLTNGMQIKEVFHIIRHDNMYYVLFSAGERIDESEWRNVKCYIGSGTDLGVITETEEIENELYIQYPEYFMAVGAASGLFVYYCALYAVSGEYLIFEGYDIHAEKSVMSHNPFGTSANLMSDMGIWLNAVLTDKYIFAVGLDKEYHIKLYVTDFHHNRVKEFASGDTYESPKFDYISSNKNDRIYFSYSAGSVPGSAKCGILNTLSLEYYQYSFDYSDLANEVLEYLIAYDGNLYEKPSLNEINYDLERYYVYAVSSGTYATGIMSFRGMFVKKEDQKKYYKSMAVDITFDIYTHSYIYSQIGSVYDLGEKYTLASLGDRIEDHNILFYGLNRAGAQGLGKNSISKIASYYSRGIYAHDEGPNSDQDYIIKYNSSGLTVEIRPEIEIAKGEI